jgi:hypothetical protein
MLALQTSTPNAVAVLPFSFVRVLYKKEFWGRVLKGEGEDGLQEVSSFFPCP